MSRQRYGIAISKANQSALTADDKDLEFSSRVDQPKVLITTQISLDLPAETLSSTAPTPDTSVHTETYAHNLGYIPMFIPEANLQQYTDSGGTADPSSTDDYYVNDKGPEQMRFATGFTSPFTETIQIYATSTEIVLEVERFFVSFMGAGTYDFGEHTVYVDITVFYNRVDELLDLT